ncbi:MAG: nucleotide exchange factor GrpE [Ilumatobacter sp.]|uniref:nucleotide exchange factor GrpE n=1 Tax=Ilumatobacter sp. TaxID=1967498 RepID=UPI003C76ADB0
MSDADQILEPDTGHSTTVQGDVADAEITRGEWETTRSERDSYLDSLQRTQAEFANYRKRVSRDQTVAGARARNGVWQRILPLIDAIDSARRHDDAARLLWNVALDVLARDDIERIAPEPGDRFDPKTQHALTSTATPGSDVVVATLIRPGYRHGDQILRPADVDVTARTGPAGFGEGADSEED